jgi:hypothetical protein
MRGGQPVQRLPAQPAPAARQLLRRERKRQAGRARTRPPVGSLGGSPRLPPNRAVPALPCLRHPGGSGQCGGRRAARGTAEHESQRTGRAHAPCDVGSSGSTVARSARSGEVTSARMRVRAVRACELLLDGRPLTAPWARPVGEGCDCAPTRAPAAVRAAAIDHRRTSAAAPLRCCAAAPARAHPCLPCLPRSAGAAAGAQGHRRRGHCHAHGVLTAQTPRPRVREQ